MTIDTSREAVERLARDHQTVGDCHKTYVMGHPHHWKTAQVLTALLAERDAALAEVARLSTPPDHLALVAAAYRDAAEQCRKERWNVSHLLSNPPQSDAARMIGLHIAARTPADAEAHLTALLRAEYERGAEAGWNAARTSVYGICEDIEDRASTDLEKPQVSEYSAGYLEAEKSTAKRIRRAMGSFAARDDDNFLALLTQEGR